ncbi:MAG TPA: glutamate dehydrogenase, partial [Patescibacteria group bacterium]
ALKNLVPKEYIAGPDVATGEEEMAVFVEVNGSPKAATGKPQSMKGLPHELGSTGIGVAWATLVACQHVKLNIAGATVAIEGFGNVGTFAASKLSQEGAKIVAVSDSTGAIYNPNGLDIQKLLDVKKKTGSVTKYQDCEILEGGRIFELAVDILIPAALGDVITNVNADKVLAKIVIEAANLPVSHDAEEKLAKKGILVVPDIVANAGGVISSYAEYMGYNKEKMFELVKSKITKNTQLILEKSKKSGTTSRISALNLARERLGIKAR